MVKEKKKVSQKIEELLSNRSKVVKRKLEAVSKKS